MKKCLTSAFMILEIVMITFVINLQIVYAQDFWVGNDQVSNMCDVYLDTNCSWRFKGDASLACTLEFVHNDWIEKKEYVLFIYVRGRGFICQSSKRFPDQLIGWSSDEGVVDHGHVSNTKAYYQNALEFLQNNREKLPYRSLN